jgi:hypothetical protein
MTLAIPIMYQVSIKDVQSRNLNKEVTNNEKRITAIKAKIRFIFFLIFNFLKTTVVQANKKTYIILNIIINFIGAKIETSKGSFSPFLRQT